MRNPVTILAALLAIWATVPESGAGTRRRHDDAPAANVARLEGIRVEDQRGGGGGSGSLLLAPLSSRGSAPDEYSRD
jgi:hypothetical protein